MIGLVLCGVLVACNSLKTMETDKFYQRIDYYCMFIYTQRLIWPATRPHYLLNFGSEKIGPNQIKSFIVLDYAEVCNELAGPISASLRPGNTATNALPLDQLAGGTIKLAFIKQRQNVTKVALFVLLN